VEQYLAKRFPTGTLPARLAPVLQRRTEGNPLFLVNLVNDLIEQSLFVQGEGGWAFQGTLETIETQVPETSRQLIMRQMDRLTPQAAQTLEVASIAGIEFSAAAVATALEADAGEIEQHCNELVRREEFLRRAGLSEWPDGTQSTRYGFRHALYQELWHERVPMQRRQRFHLTIGARLEQAYGNRAGEIATELAVHFEQGQNTQRAIRYYQNAAGTATQRHAYQEAIAHFTAALSLLKNLPETAERHQQELQLQHSLHWMLGRSKGEAAPEIDGVAARERELLQWGEETPQLFGAVFGLFTFYLVRGELSSVRSLAEHALRLARRFPEQPLLGSAYFMLGCSDFLAGELLSARTSFEQAMAIYTQSQTEASLFWETGLLCFSFAALNLWHLGFPNQALHRASEAITRARICDARFIEAFGLNSLAWVHMLRGDIAAVRTHATAALQLSEAQGFASAREMGRIYHGWVLSMQEDEHKGTLLIRQGIADFRSTGGITYRTYYLALLAEAYGKTRQIEEGLSVLDEALALVDKTGERFYEAELYRLRGELTLSQSKTSLRQVLDKSRTSQDKFEDTSPQSLAPNTQAVVQEVEECFLKAIEIARQRQAKIFELRAVMSLSRLWIQQRKKVAARQMLAEIYGWFTEGFDTVDLQEAKALLSVLSTPHD
jgi:tetratricopeptide (TPR) repeat protein